MRPESDGAVSLCIDWSSSSVSDWTQVALSHEATPTRNELQLGILRPEGACSSHLFMASLRPSAATPNTSKSRNTSEAEVDHAAAGAVRLAGPIKAVAQHVPKQCRNDCQAAMIEAPSYAFHNNHTSRWTRRSRWYAKKRSRADDNTGAVIMPAADVWARALWAAAPGSAALRVPALRTRASSARGT